MGRKHFGNEILERKKCRNKNAYMHIKEGNGG
jgi:hypothetical protein